MYSIWSQPFANHALVIVQKRLLFETDYLSNHKNIIYILIDDKHNNGDCDYNVWSSLQSSRLNMYELKKETHYSNHLVLFVVYHERHKKFQ